MFQNKSMAEFLASDQVLLTNLFLQKAGGMNRAGD